MRLRVLALVVVAAFGGQSALAQSDGLRRLTDRDDLLGWEAVGRLDTARGGFCTATLIASDLVLTAAHCVYDRDRLRDPGELTFRAGLSDGVAIAERSIAAIAVPEAYRPGPRVDLSNVPHDVALLRLNRAITTAEADPFVLHQGSIRGQEISVTSYGQGRAEALSRQQRCRIVGERSPILAFDCNVTFGSSGAPVFVKHGDRGRILSIISGGSRTAEGVVSIGMELPGVVGRLKADLRRQGTPTPTIRRFGIGDGKGSSGAKFVRPDGS
ncbi:trypsin-like peptidase domain-containing protein [Aestuariivita sp.]|jgi:protease YdgD|uniref:trypsin-like serine peptidase n=1 Tax=Aestuariivita sp. TaxID=1872407 RepID=UPI002170AC01|nr:trypsin-like peptidase domain-containing protein [Aestuariivita sp.]MCE8006282.1 trypsin-like serine protease [Aestuariivita sp.]